MKMGYVALALIVLISALLLIFTNYLSKAANDMTAQIENINDYIEKKDYNTAFSYYKKLKEKWEKSEKIIQFQIENEELDNINGIIAEIDSYFERNFFEDFFEASYRLDFFINHLYEKNVVSLETVL